MWNAGGERKAVASLQEKALVIQGELNLSFHDEPCFFSLVCIEIVAGRPSGRVVRHAHGQIAVEPG